MSDPTDRPGLLRDAAAAIAYERWLKANGFEDSDANAWRFAAEAGGAGHTSDDPTLGKQPSTKPRARWLVPGLVVLAVALVLGAVTAYGVLSAERWTKVDSEEEGRTVQVPTGQWTVTEDRTDLICYQGQNWGSCIDDMQDQYDIACVGRVFGLHSKVICDAHLHLIRYMKTKDISGTVDTPGGTTLERSLVTEPEWVVDVPERTHEAICYLGFLGECPEGDPQHE